MKDYDSLLFRALIGAHQLVAKILLASGVMLV